MTVPFEELSGSPVEYYGNEGMRAERRILCAWGSRGAMVQELMGDGYTFGGATRALYPDKQSVVAMDVRVEPWVKRADYQPNFDDITEDLNTYSNHGQLALVTIKYELIVPSPPSWFGLVPESNTFLSYEMHQSVEYMTRATAATGMTWAGNPSLPVAPDAVPPQRIGVAEHRLSWHRVTSPPWDAIKACRGCVSGEAWGGVPAECILFEGATARRDFVDIPTVDDPRVAWTLDYVFRERTLQLSSGMVGVGSGTVGWNHTWRNDPLIGPGWDRLVDGNNQPLYPTVSAAALNNLFKYAGS